jgi:hypothetical protein
LFIALAVLSTMPLVFQVHTHLTIGAEPSATVPLLNLWTLGWNVDRLGHGYQGYWDAPIYYPTRGTFALSEPLTAAGWMAWPLWQLLPGAVSVYNVLLLLLLALNGWVTCQLLKRLGVVWPAALAGGAMVGLLPLVHWQLGVFQLVSMWGICWTFYALHGAFRQRRLRDGLHLGLAFSCTYLLCCYYGLMLSLLLLLCAPLWCGKRLLEIRFWGCCGVALVTAAVLLGPIVVPQIVVAQRYGADSPQEIIRQLSVVPADYWTTPRPQWLPLPHLPRSGESPVWSLSPGTLKLVFAAVGSVWGLRTRRHRRLVLFLLALALAAMLMSMGPRLSWNGFSPYTLLAAYYPGYRHVRNVFRFAYFVQLAIALLAALGLEGVYRLAGRCSDQRAWRCGAVVLLIGLGVMLAGETWPPPPHTFALPSLARHATWIEWLRDEPQADARLVCFPLAPGRSAADHEQTATWMYFQLRHQRPLANGYSASIPEDYLRMESALSHFPDAPGVAALQRMGVTHCLFDALAGAQADPVVLRSLGCELAMDDRRAQVQIWRLPPMRKATPRSTGSHSRKSPVHRRDPAPHHGSSAGVAWDQYAVPGAASAPVRVLYHHTLRPRWRSSRWD